MPIHLQSIRPATGGKERDLSAGQSSRKAIGRPQTTSVKPSVISPAKPKQITFAMPRQTSGSPVQAPAT